MMAVRGLKSKPIFTAGTTVTGARQGSVVGGEFFHDFGLRNDVGVLMMMVFRLTQ